ncbi:hypothetical protein ACHAWF_012922 [Thalassiosira exigua]
MEDRHSVSEPRFVENVDESTPAWEVDILRDDTVIVDTFLLDNDVLPPRTNKKGKVVWRLPDAAKKLVSFLSQPSFGTDDRRRILDIFKERKKKRKQDKKKRNLSPSQDPGAGKCDRRSSTESPGKKRVGSGEGGGGTETENFHRSGGGGKPPEEKAADVGGSKTKGKGKENGKSLENSLKQPGGQDGNIKGQRRKKDEAKVDRGKELHGQSSSKGPQHSMPSLLSHPPPPKHGTPPRQTYQAKIDRGKELHGEILSKGPHHPRPRLPSTQPHSKIDTPPRQTYQSTAHSSLPIPDQSHIKSRPIETHPQVPSTPDPSRLSLDDHKEPPSTSQPQLTQKNPILSSLLSSQNPHIQQLPSDALFITIPRSERPQSLPGQPESSLAVPAARHFISKYYSHFDGTLPGAQIGDLVRYYTAKAQKSVSIGGAHSVVTGRRDIAAQILNLAGAAFVVRGVVAQDTADGKGVHILVTGTARTSITGSVGGVLASFAHSVSLVPVDEVMPKSHGENGGTIGHGSCPALAEALQFGYPFQIHNDALALLSGDTGPVTPAPIPQPVMLQQQHPPPPPPGLF